MSQIRQLIKLCLPSGFILLKQKFFPKQQSYGWFGDYESWDDAMIDSTGYDKENILEKVRVATIKLRENPVLFEYDTILKESTDYNWHILTFLLLVSKENKNNLKIIDYGGGLGNLYFQYRRFLMGISISWNIVEQPNFVNQGNLLFKNDELRFFNTIEECLEEGTPHAVIFSGVVDVIENPYELICKIINKNIHNIIFDRVPLTKVFGKDRITVLKVYRDAYEAVIPCRIFDEDNFKELFFGTYVLLFEGLSKEKAIWVDNKSVEKKFLFYKIKN